MPEYLLPFSNIFFVKGYKQSILCDSQRKNIEIVPNSMIEIFKEFKKYSISELEDKYSEDIDILIEYKEFLLDKEFAFVAKEKEKSFFPDKNLEWYFPANISNSIIDIVDYQSNNVFNYIKQLDAINCKNIQFRFFNEIKCDELEQLMTEVSNYSFQTIDLILNYAVLSGKLVEFVIKFTILGNLILYNSIENKTETTDSKTNIIKSTKETIKISDCGIISKAYFVMNDEHFNESQCHNTCLNRKISIDVNGEIKNCPSMKQSFGNIKDTTLQEALEKPGFKDLWTIKKDEIEVCKDCEFRHICTDCRAFIKDPENIYSQPAKCGYNPYIAKWESQEGYITVEEWRKLNNNEQITNNN